MPCNCGPDTVAGVMQGLSGLAQAEVLDVSSAITHARDLWRDIERLFGIGAGRREADVIVPLQNDVHRTLIAPVSDFLTQYKVDHAATCAELQQWKARVVQGETQWLSFLHTTQWQDGRAAMQGEATLKPYFDNAKHDLDTFIEDKCGTIGGGIITDEQGNLNWPVILGIGGIALLALRRK